MSRAGSTSASAAATLDESTPPPAAPERQREHAVEPAGEVGAVLLVEVDEALGVGTGAEDVPPPLERVPQRRLVVDLAVVGNPDRLVLVGHRLRAAGEVDDR